MVPSAPNPSQGAGSSATPAYASAPRRTGLLIALAGIVVVAAIAAVAIFMTREPAPGTGSAGAPQGAPAETARKELDARKATLEEAARGVLQPAAAPTAAEGASSQDAAPSPAVAGEAKPLPDPATVAAPAGPAARPPEAKGEAPAARVPSAPPAKAPAPAAKASSPPAKPAPKAPAPPAPAAVPPVAPAASPNAEHWARMNEELSRCSNDSVIPRIQCERRIRARYCEGYWGTVPECPGGRTGPVN